MSNHPYSSIVVNGDDAFDFLQAQLSADLRELSANESVSHMHPDSAHRDASVKPILSAWCNPKGRVICLMTVAKVNDGFTLTLPAVLADDVVRRLSIFRFRSKVEFTVREATQEIPESEDSVDQWRLNNLRAGVPEILQEQSEKYTPHMLNLDLLGAVSVDKGCYPGQEIVARTHFRGATKRRCLRFESATAVAAGDKVTDGDRDVGEVLNAIGTDLLAVVLVDKASAQLFVDGVPLTHVLVEYLGPHMREEQDITD